MPWSFVYHSSFSRPNDPKDWSNTFFVNEIEYNYSVQIATLKTVNDKNGFALLSHQQWFSAHYVRCDKQGAIQRLAAILTPDRSIATQLALAPPGQAQKAFVDWKKLDQGYKVPLIKESEDWAISLDKAVEGILNLWNSPAEKQDKGLSTRIICYCFSVRDRTTNWFGSWIWSNWIWSEIWRIFSDERVLFPVDYQFQAERYQHAFECTRRKIVTLEGSHVYDAKARSAKNGFLILEAAIMFPVFYWPWSVDTCDSFDRCRRKDDGVFSWRSQRSL